MSHRPLLSTALPVAYETLMALDDEVFDAANQVGVEDRTLQLVRIRVSQINGCAYGLRLHGRAALDNGERIERIAVLPAWRAATCFTDAERGALAATEAAIGASQGCRTATPNGPARWRFGDATLSSRQAAAVRWVAVVVDATNQLAVASRYRVGPPL